MYKNIDDETGKIYPRVWLEKSTAQLYVVRPYYSTLDFVFPSRINGIMLYDKQGFCVSLAKGWEKDFYIDLGEL